MLELHFNAMLLQKNYYNLILFLFALLFAIPLSYAQNAIWIEDFDDGGGGRWTLENAPGSMTNPTPAGIVGLTYGVNAAVAHDNWIINDRNTPELDADIVVGTSIVNQGQFVRGRHYVLRQVIYRILSLMVRLPVRIKVYTLLRILPVEPCFMEGLHNQTTGIVFQIRTMEMCKRKLNRFHF